MKRLFCDRWQATRLASLFDENTQLNADFAESHALQFKYGSIVEKKQYELTDDLIATYKKYTMVQPGDIMINSLNLNYDFVTQRVALVPTNGIITSAYISLRPRSGISTEFYNYYFKALDSIKLFNGMGTGIRLTLSYDLLKNLVLPVPPRAEQDQIVRYLDWQVSKINRLIAAKRKQIVQLREQIQQITTNMVYHGIDPNVLHKSVKMLYVDKIPAHWECKRGKYLLAEHDIRSVDGKEELLSVSHITGVTPRSQKNITMFKSESLVNYKICRKGDIAANTMWMWQGAIAVSSYHGVISPSYNTYHQIGNVFDSTYLDFMLRTKPLVDEYYVRSTGIRKSRLRLYPEQLLGMFFPVPPIDEQRMIADRIVERTQAINDMICTIEKQIERINELRTHLVSDVVTGQMDVRGIEIPHFEMVDEIDTEESVEEDTNEQTE